jgi:hypothetical protein
MTADMHVENWYRSAQKVIVDGAHFEAIVQ